MPEITNTLDLFKIIKDLTARDEYLTFLEIGSSNGLGSTRAFIEGIASRAQQTGVRYYCLEMYQPAFQELLTNTQAFPFIKCYNESSAAFSELPGWEDVLHFYKTTQTKLNDYPIETVLNWYNNGLQYATLTGLTRNGVKRIKEENEIRNFDFVLIDGSEFTGEQDLYSTIGARCIALDDVMTYKCHHAFNVLMAHHSYKLSVANFDERHGFAVFTRTY